MRKQAHLLVISVCCKPNFALIDESFVKVRLSVDFVVEQWDASAFGAAWHEAEAVQPAALHRPESAERQRQLGEQAKPFLFAVRQGRRDSYM